MVVFPNAKINLGLNIISKRIDNFHILESVFYPIPWCDVLEIIVSKKTQFSISGNAIPGNINDNLCMKIYSSMQKVYDLPPVSMHLHKNIPVGAGLGGGSSDAAFTVKLLNDLFNLNIPSEDQIDFIKPYGSDCAFFIQNRPVLALGKGDEFEPVNLSLKGKFIVLVYPDLFISTKEAYASVNPTIPADDIRKSINSEINQWKGILQNDFENALFPEYPLLKSIKETMYHLGAMYASMSGSGSTVYGIFEHPLETSGLFPNNYKIWKGILE